MSCLFGRPRNFVFPSSLEEIFGCSVKLNVCATYIFLSLEGGCCCCAFRDISCHVSAQPLCCFGFKLNLYKEMHRWPSLC